MNRRILCHLGGWGKYLGPFDDKRGDEGGGVGWPRRDVVNHEFVALTATNRGNKMGMAPNG